jgi:hypothetical protein
MNLKIGQLLPIGIDDFVEHGRAIRAHPRFITLRGCILTATPPISPAEGKIMRLLWSHSHQPAYDLKIHFRQFHDVAFRHFNPIATY